MEVNVELILKGESCSGKNTIAEAITKEIKKYNVKVEQLVWSKNYRSFILTGDMTHPNDLMEGE